MGLFVESIDNYSHFYYYVWWDFVLYKFKRKDWEEMELIKTKELYENDAFVIIEAEFEDSETKKRIQEIALGLKNNLSDITKIRTIHRKQI